MRYIATWLTRVTAWVLLSIGGATFAEPIVVANYGIATSAMPYAIALKKGYFQEVGVDVDAIIDLEGAEAVGRLVRDNLAYAEVAPLSAALAAQSGMDVRIVSGNVYSLAGYAWVALPSSPINSIKDLKNRRLGYSRVGATTDALNRLMLASVPYSPQDVTLSVVGGVLPLLTYLEVKGIDAAPIPEPMRSMVSAKYKTIAVATDVLPPMADVVGLTTAAGRRDKEAFIRGVLEARRKAIEYLHANTADAASIIAPVYKADPAVIERVLRGIIASEKAKGEPYWDTAGIVRRDLIRRAITVPAPTLVGGDAAASDANLARLIDDTFLADSARSVSGQQ